MGECVLPADERPAHQQTGAVASACIDLAKLGYHIGSQNDRSPKL